MRYRLLSEDRLKIVMESQDLIEYGITFAEIDYRNPKTKEVFWKVINNAREETGFNPSGCKLLIEAFPEGANNVLLYVTKISCDKTVKPEDWDGLSGRSYIFLFEEADSFLDSCVLFEKSNIEIIEKNLYYHNNRYYLYFMPIAISKEECKELNALLLNLSEYGKMIENEKFQYFLEEHAKFIGSVN